MSEAEPRISCPSCGRGHDAIEWISPSAGRCRLCLERFDFFAFPAFTRKTGASKPRAVAVEAEASCYFHPQNLAEKLCDGCGRFLCPVCAVPVGTETLCGICISSRQKTDTRAVPGRMLWGGIALALAVFPIFFWPLTLLTAPATVFVAIRGWSQPRSIVSPGRASLIAALLIALLQIGGWVFFLYTILSR